MEKLIKLQKYLIVKKENKNEKTIENIIKILNSIPLSNASFIPRELAPTNAGIDK